MCYTKILATTEYGESYSSYYKLNKFIKTGKDLDTKLQYGI